MACIAHWFADEYGAAMVARPGHYYWLTAFLAARGLQKTTCRVVALVIFGMSAVSVLLIWRPTGPHGLRDQILAIAVAVCCWGMTAIWLRGRWPSASRPAFVSVLDRFALRFRA